MKSLGLCGLRPCSCRVQASKEDAWATISTLCPADGEEGVGRRSSDRKQHRPRTNTEVHLHRADRAKTASRCCAERLSHRCSCSPTGYLWSLGSCGSCSSRKVRTQSACWLASEVCGCGGTEDVLKTPAAHIFDRLSKVFFNTCETETIHYKAYEENIYRPIKLQNPSDVHLRHTNNKHTLNTDIVCCVNVKRLQLFMYWSEKMWKERNWLWSCLTQCHSEVSTLWLECSF